MEINKNITKLTKNIIENKKEKRRMWEGSVGKRVVGRILLIQHD
jgi:hypothetical protein